MPEHTSPSFHDLIIRAFTTLEAKDLEAMMSLFADHTVVILSRNLDVAVQQMVRYSKTFATV